MKFKLILIIFLFLSKMFSQNENSFVIDNYMIDSKLESAIINNTEKENFFEDEEFIVTKSCSGEFGGSLFFKDKKTLIVYECQSICARVINKINDEYIVTNTLAHLNGSSHIFGIRNPRLLKKFKEREYKPMKYVGEDESNSTLGTRKILDSIGVLTLVSFPYKNKLYHLIDDGKIKIAEIVNGKYREVKTIIENNISFYNVLINDKKHYIIQFEEKDKKGYFDLFENRIKIYWIK